MRHLLGFTVYGDIREIPGTGPACDRLRAAGADGIELLTGYGSVDAAMAELTEAVHLPYATDWYGVWSGRISVPEDMADENVSHMFYGRSRDGICEAIRRAIAEASVLDPGHAVLHAGNANTDDLMVREQSDRDEDVLLALAEAVNAAISRLPGGRPPMRILFENLWWPGLTLRSPSGFRILERKLEFDDWGICMDTGHLLVALGGTDTEDEAIDLLLRTVDSYPGDMMDRIEGMHLHLNTSAGFMRGYRKSQTVPGTREGRIAASYDLICGSDSHDPFTSSRVRDLVDAVSPMTVTHEMKTQDPSGMMSDFICQRSIFKDHVR